MDLAPGTTVDRYTVEARLGEGGMAVVYRVRHNSLGSVHALKVLSGSMSSVRERLLQEGRLQASLRHPNVKPGNVLIARTTAGSIPKVADFGLAKVLAGDGVGAMRQTRTGTAMGTPSYMAPEQIRSAKGVDGRADLFSLGAVLYELYCGELAFPGEDMWTIFSNITSVCHRGFMRRVYPTGWLRRSRGRSPFRFTSGLRTAKYFSVYS